MLAVHTRPALPTRTSTHYLAGTPLTIYLGLFLLLQEKEKEVRAEHQQKPDAISPTNATGYAR